MPAVSLPTILETLRNEAASIDSRFGLRIVGVVGSMARGDFRPDSDIDVLVERSGHPSLFEVEAAEAYLSSLFGRRTDIIVRSGLPPHWRTFTDGELVAA